MRNHHCVLLPLGLILLVIGVVTLVIFGLGNLEPYGYTRNFHEATCNVLSSNVTTYHTCEHINPADTDLVIYSSGHSCLRVQVNFTEKVGKTERAVSAYLYDSYETLISTRDYNITCTLHICQEDVEDNEEDVLEFEKSYGQVGHSYKCYYNPQNTQEVFVYIPTSSHVLHAILWPSMALGFGIFILVIVIFSSCEVWICMPWRQKQQLQSPGQHHHHHHHNGPKHSYELATVKYGQEREKNAYRA